MPVTYIRVDHFNGGGSLASIAKKIIVDLALIAVKENKSISLVDEDMPVIVIGDPDALEPAVRNLVENALAYTRPESAVEVKVSADGSISVTDHGPGVPEHERTAIFERFWRGEHSKGKQGTGLGLALVKKIAESHGGTIEVGEAPHGGAIFTLKLNPIETARPFQAAS